MTEVRVGAAQRMTGHSRHARANAEAGSSLILALIFLVVSGLVVISLATWTANDLNNSAKFTSAEALKSAANSAVELAVQNTRYTFAGQSTNISLPQPCWGSSSQFSAITVYCSTLWSPASASTRVVTYSACRNTVTSAAACAASPLLQSVVTFDDYGPIATAISLQACNATCGTGVKVNNWDFGTAPPTAVPVAPATNFGSGPQAGGTIVNIAGSGFVTGQTIVYFVNSATITGLIPAVTPQTGGTSTSISVKAPTVNIAGTYFVIVQTPTGVSTFSPTTSTFTYT